MESEILTVEEAAELLKIHPKTLRAKAGKVIPGTKVLGAWRFIKVDLLNWLRQSGGEQSTPAAANEVKTAWQSTNVAKSGGRVLPTMDKKYADLLALPTSRPRKNGTTN